MGSSPPDLNSAPLCRLPYIICMNERTSTQDGDKDMAQERILIVEDEENARDGLAELISAW